MTITLMSMSWPTSSNKQGKSLWVSGVLVVLTVSCGTQSVTDNGPLLPTADSMTTTTSRVAHHATMTTSMADGALDGKSEDLVAVSFDAVMARRIECGRRPRQCDVSSLASVDSPLHERLTALMEQRVRAGITASRRGSVRYRIDDIIIMNSGEAVVTTCLTDDTVLMSAGGIFDDSLYSAMTTWTMRFEEGRWLWLDDQVVDWRHGEDLCAFDQ